jgi:hypothetical protein
MKVYLHKAQNILVVGEPWSSVNADYFIIYTEYSQWTTSREYLVNHFLDLGDL